MKDVLNMVMNDKRQTILAYGIAEWDSAIGHLHAVELAMPGRAAPYWGIRLSDELLMMVRRWPGAEHTKRDDVAAINAVVTEARIWVQDHQEELGEVLNHRQE